MSDATPSRPTADRNLLFGVLALQMDFISRDALIKAMNSWVLEKGKPLAQILVEQGALAAERRRLLEPLVDEHVKQHDDNIERSLAAVPLAPAVRHALRAVADSELQASLNSLGATPDRVLDLTGPYQPPPSDGSRYRVLRPHARGGLGEVFVAEDTELHREVALKEIHAEYAQDPHSRTRFLLEAEVNGRLEHPHIVPVYGLGAYPDGRPYYAMRFIQGTTLKDAIHRFHAQDTPGRDSGQRSLALRQLLGQFVAVCYAVAYAHSRGVVHRDVKPANVLLGPFGETLLVDWGLAKVVGRAEGGTGSAEVTLRPATGSELATRAGTALGTPAYMSPEQAAGHLDRIGPASDVYGLGATLYAVLAGHPPVEGRDEGKLLRRVTQGDWPRPSQVAMGVPRVLEAVCLKAMALEPEQRYASAHELAADLERWLADEPVSCYREPAVARLARWGRKHRPAVAGAAALLMTAVVALTVSTVLIRREQQGTEAARQEEARQRARAEENGARAQESFRKARQAVDDYLTYVSESKLLDSPLPGLQPLRKDLLTRALKFYQEFAEQHQEDPALRADLAQAYYRVGKIQREIGTTADALHAYDQALGLWQSLLAEDPTHRAYRLGKSKVLTAMAGARVKQPGQRDEGLAAYKAAVTLLEKLVQEQSADLESRAALADSYSYLADALSTNSGGGTTNLEGVARSQKALAIYQELARREPKYRLGVASMGMNLGLRYTELHKAVPALRYHQESLARLEELSRERPPEVWLRQEMARAHTNIAYAHYVTARNFAEALKHFDQSRLIDEQLARENPSVNNFQFRLGSTCEWCARLHLVLGQPEKARELATQAIELLNKGPLEQDRSRSITYSRAETYIMLGSILSRLNRDQEAQEAYQGAVEAWLQYGQTVPPSNVSQIRGVFTSYVQGKAWPPDRAIKLWQTAAQLYEGAVHTGRGPKPQNLRGLLWALGGLGDAYRDAGKKAEANSTYQQAIDTWQKELGRDKSIAETMRTVLHASLELAPLRVGEGRYVEARELLLLAQDLLASGKASSSEDFDKARLNMLFASLVGAGESERTDAENAERRRYHAGAVEALRRAASSMSSPTAARIRNEPVLLPLQAREEFQQLLAGLEAKEKFLKEWPERIKQAQAWVKQGDHPRAAAEAAALAKSPHATTALWSAAADLHAECFRAARQDDALPQDRRNALARAYADEAVRLLRRLRAAVQANNRSITRNYELARVNARLAALVGHATESDEQAADSEFLASEAVVALRSFVAEGRGDPTSVKRDEVWDPLRGRADFQQLEALGDALVQESRRLQQAEELAWADKHAEATAVVAGLAESMEVQPRTLFHSARIYALCAAAVGRDEKQGATEQERLARQYADRAVELLRQATARGLKANDRNMVSEARLMSYRTSDGGTINVRESMSSVAIDVDFLAIMDRQDFQELQDEWKPKRAN
jgi:serine/threonine-protein kinase